MADKPQAPQKDFWAGTAAPPPNGGGNTPAPDAGNEDWKLWQSGGTEGQSQTPTGIDALTEIEPANKRPGILGHALTAASNVGAGVLSPLSLMAHLPEAAKGLAHTLASPYGNPDPESLPGQAATSFMAKPVGNLEALPGAMMTGEIGGAALGGMKANLGERFGGYKSPVIDPALQNASKLATAIRPPGGVDYDLEPTLAKQMPLIKAFAQEQGNPMHSQWEAAQAARQLADKGKMHFKENVLGPNTEAQIPVTGLQQYQGFTGPNITQGRMNLGQIEGRIGEINNLLRPAGGAKTAGASLTALEKAGWMKELSMLQNKLYTELGQRSGLEPEAIKGMRQNYGQQYDIADTIDSARRARLGPQGAAAEGGSIPLSKTGALDKLATWARGGQEYLANKNFRKAASPFAPVEPEFPQPQYPQKLQGDEFNNPFLNRRK